MCQLSVITKNYSTIIFMVIAIDHTATSSGAVDLLSEHFRLLHQHHKLLYREFGCKYQQLSQLFHMIIRMQDSYNVV